MDRGITGHTFINGDRIKVDGVAGMVELNDRVFTVANVGVNTVELNDDAGVNINSGAFGAYAGPGSAYLATRILAAHSHRKFGGIGDVGSMGGGGLATLTGGETIEVYVKNISGAQAVTLEYVALSIFRV